MGVERRGWKGEGSWEPYGGVEGTPWDGAGECAGTDPWVLLEQVILGEIFSDYTPAQVVVKELRASAGPLEQRKFISEAQPYRYGDLWVDMEPGRPEYLSVCLMAVMFGSRRSTVWSQLWIQILDVPFPGCANQSRSFPSLSLRVFLGPETGT